MQHLKNNDISEGGYVVICEGEFDQMMLEQAGIMAVTSTAGATTFKEEWVQRLELVHEIYICLDNDEVGKKAMTTLADRLRTHYPLKKIATVDFPPDFEGKDVTDFMLAGGDFGELLTKSRDTIDQQKNSSTSTQEHSDKKDDTASEKPSQPEKIITYLGDDTIFFLDEVNNPYALVHFEDHAETMPISSKIFRLLLSKRYYDETGKAPNHESLAQALSICEGKAYFGKIRHPLDIRVARRDNAFLYDLCDDTWQYVEIRPDGWSTHRHHEPIFRRYTQMQVQILPTQSDTSPFRIFDFLNVKEDKKLLVLVYILSLFIADMPHPVLIVHGSR